MICSINSFNQTLFAVEPRQDIIRENHTGYAMQEVTSGGQYSRTGCMLS